MQGFFGMKKEYDFSKAKRNPCRAHRRYTLAELLQCVEDNPDLTYSQIKDILRGIRDYKKGKSKVYKRNALSKSK
jgi:hypothetical protein